MGLTEAIFLSKLHPVPSEDPAEEMGHRAANTPAACSMAFLNRKKEGRRETEREKERDYPPRRGNHCSQGCFDFQKLINVHPDKIPAARGNHCRQGSFTGTRKQDRVQNKRRNSNKHRQAPVSENGICSMFPVTRRSTLHG